MLHMNVVYVKLASISVKHNSYESSVIIDEMFRYLVVHIFTNYGKYQ